MARVEFHLLDRAFERALPHQVFDEAFVAMRVEGLGRRRCAGRDQVSIPFPVPGYIKGRGRLKP